MGMHAPQPRAGAKQFPRLILKYAKKSGRFSSHARQAVLIELARVRLHGFTEREMRAARGVQMAETESLFTERDQEYSDSRRCAAVLRPIALALLRPG